jgi:multidrug efflux pump subunit AcrB
MIFAMLISLFDGLVVAPMLSAYFTGKVSHKVNFLVRGFQRFQDRLETLYVRIMTFGLRRPFVLLYLQLVVSQNHFLVKNNLNKAKRRAICKRLKRHVHN